MKRILNLCLFLFSMVSVFADTPKIGELFKLMPDSLMPYLTKNNRLDMIDFREAGMKAEVNNLLEGISTMTYLSDDSLCVKMSDALRIDMKLIVKGDNLLVRVQKTYNYNKCQTEEIVSLYTPDWQLVDTLTKSSFLLKRDEELFKEN